MAKDGMSTFPGNAEALLRPTFAEVELSAIAENLKQIQSVLHKGCGVLAMVKADAYGHGIEPVARLLAARGVSCFGVVRLEEAIELREARIKTPILVISGLLPAGFESAIRHDVMIGVIDWEMLENLEAVAAKLAAKKMQPKVHMKIDTGMHRLGIPHADYMQQVERRLKKLKYVQVVGVYSHLANADNLEDDFVMQQRARFAEAALLTEKLVGTKLTKHLANSDGVFRSPELHFDLVRPGIALYGYCKRAVRGLRPAMHLKSRIIQIQQVKRGESVGYDRFFRAERDSRVAIMPLGYADGYSRAYTGSVVGIRGGRGKVVGRVCMDLLIVDVTDIAAAKVGDVALLLGEADGVQVSAFDLGRISGTTHYQVLTSIQPRVPRIYLGEGKAS